MFLTAKLPIHEATRSNGDRTIVFKQTIFENLCFILCLISTLIDATECVIILATSLSLSPQVSVMQVELTNLRPELIKTSEETDKIMVKIEHDSIEVEAKKEVRGCIV